MTDTHVPRLVGLTVPQARKTGHDAGVVVTSRDVDGPPLGALTWPGTWIVTAQHPTAGERVPRGTPVAVDFEERPDAGGAGDREPRHPLPRRDEPEADPLRDRAE
ncbi:PASTA domain-containing protein [Saccharothrix saharensis]|uniref:PASTA domain-containing protein n=1 Tax=Saccharothrix saharensis TaxID=571190 RepID=A0A543JC22_9PSEU|nr:PASTA domain-containing protein [Saccharothrix saharensis]TQM80360.1 PASTA domain-containing protein [Saccharothrix saharensis]